MTCLPQQAPPTCKNLSKRRKDPFSSCCFCSNCSRRCIRTAILVWNTWGVNVGVCVCVWGFKSSSAFKFTLNSSHLWSLVVLLRPSSNRPMAPPAARKPRCPPAAPACPCPGPCPFSGLISPLPSDTLSSGHLPTCALSLPSSLCLCCFLFVSSFSHCAPLMAKPTCPSAIPKTPLPPGSPP